MRYFRAVEFRSLEAPTEAAGGDERVRATFVLECGCLATRLIRPSQAVAVDEPDGGPGATMIAGKFICKAHSAPEGG